MFAVPGWSVSSSELTQQGEAQTKDQSQGKDTSTPNAKKDNKRKRGNDRVTSSNVDEMYRRHIEGNSGPKGGKRGKAGANAGAGAPDNSLKPWEKKKLQKEQQQASAAGVSNETNEVPKVEAEAGQEDGKPAKKQKRNRKNKNKDGQQDKTEEQGATASPSTEVSAAVKSVGPSLPAASATLTPLQQAMRQKLISSRFRHLNETLYTTDSSKAVELFNANPELFDEYHAGFSRQVKESWPSNPVDDYIQTVRRRGAVPVPKRGKPDPNKPLPLPRRPNGACTIADLGCGDAGLARALTPSAKKLNLKLNSYDLQAPDALITKADISNLPLEDGTVDVAIFCLSLMGTNWVSFVEEAWRVLRGDGKGECWVSEVKSRFGKVARKKSQIGAQKPLSKAEQKKQKKKGGKGDDEELDEADIFAEDARPTDNDETDISAFVEVFKSRGFVLKQESVDKSNKMFVKMEFVKAGWTPTKGKHASAAPAPGGKAGKKRFVEKKTDADSGMTEEQEAQVLKPCVYKIR
ncbi:hypothetical protein N7523_003353 [Penicillium sp. IBT 18751x]|nr:hypothetical protein N7523_003353 [Penicillium sp. IBT 18751x]